MLGHLRIGVVLTDHQPGIGFVVAQDDVVARPQLLDQIGFKQQRLGLRGGGDDLQPAGFEHHAAQPFRQARGLSVAGDAFADGTRLADIERVAPGIEHTIDARAERQIGQRGLDHREPVHGGGIARLWWGGVWVREHSARCGGMAARAQARGSSG